MTILVTGAAGFIGSHFVDYHLSFDLSEKVVGYDLLTYAGSRESIRSLQKKYSDNFFFIQGDICDSQKLTRIFNENSITRVINFAAETHVDNSIIDPLVFIKTNVLGTATILNVARTYWKTDSSYVPGVRFIQISTDEVYGSLEMQDAASLETDKLVPNNPYSASKASADLLVLSYFKTYGLPAIITRGSNTYGPGQYPEKLIPHMIQCALNHQKLPIYGDGKNIRDWLYVQDHVKGIDLVLRKGSIGEIYNIGGGCEKQNIEVVSHLVERLQQLTNDSQINIELISYVEDRPAHDKRYSLNCEKLKFQLGWNPNIDFDQGMEKTISYYCENGKNSPFY